MQKPPVTRSDTYRTALLVAGGIIGSDEIPKSGIGRQTQAGGTQPPAVTQCKQCTIYWTAHSNRGQTKNTFEWRSPFPREGGGGGRGLAFSTQ